MSQNSSFDPFSMSANKHFTVAQTYRITHEAARTIRHLGRFRKAHGKPFPQRIMLAVTEVNGCAMCAYAHTKFALEAGMDADEVREMLGGVSEGAPDKELPAIAFAQHYADADAKPEHSAWTKLTEIYGERDALGVLGATRMMMWGNAVGIPLSLLRARRAGKPDPSSSLRYEIVTIISSWLVLPFALLHAAASTLLRRPLMSWPTL